MTPEEIASLPPGVAISWASPAGLATIATDEKWFPGRHHLLINDHLSKISYDIKGNPCSPNKRLAVFLPPRHGKSSLCSKWLPAWFLATNPDKCVIMCSYEHDFACSWSAKARDVIVEYGKELFGVEVKDGYRASKSHWMMKGYDGELHAAGAGGPITGKGADLLIIDDPIKNSAEANSETYRERTWDWYRSTALTRLHPGASVVLIQTRWHEDDLAGRILNHAEETGEHWDIISLPAFAGQDDQLGRKEGEALWPEFYDVDELTMFKKNLGPYWFSAMYQQTPQPPEGAIFRKSAFRYFEETEEKYIYERADGTISRVDKKNCIIVQTADTALKANQQNDYTAVLTGAITQTGELLIIDVMREHLAMPDQWPAIKSLIQRYQSHIAGVEEKVSGIGILEQAKREGYPLRALQADVDKVRRVQPASLAYANGLIYHPMESQWLNDFEDELLSFPVGAHDDQVDVLAYAWQIARDNPNRGPLKRRPKPDKESERWGVPQHLIDNQRARDRIQIGGKSKRKGFFE